MVLMRIKASGIFKRVTKGLGQVSILHSFYPTVTKFEKQDVICTVNTRTTKLLFHLDTPKTNVRRISGP